MIFFSFSQHIKSFVVGCRNNLKFINNKDIEFRMFWFILYLTIFLNCKIWTFWAHTCVCDLSSQNRKIKFDNFVGFIHNLNFRVEILNLLTRKFRAVFYFELFYSNHEITNLFSRNFRALFKFWFFRVELWNHEASNSKRSSLKFIFNFSSRIFKFLLDCLSQHLFYLLKI